MRGKKQCGENPSSATLQVSPFYHRLCSSSQWFIPGICNSPNKDPIHGLTTMLNRGQSSDNDISQVGSVMMVSDVHGSF
ncbi:hypothetical protein VNO80_28299 [Phaseolus coccineus]|uniref:Uncharacterized protein n=1 Tax=Phaseolus coccineus TaxID=3886 RepID=A0AAN9QHE9_PHACN